MEHNRAWPLHFLHDQSSTRTVPDRQGIRVVERLFSRCLSDCPVDADFSIAVRHYKIYEHRHYAGIDVCSEQPGYFTRPDFTRLSKRAGRLHDCHPLTTLRGRHILEESRHHSVTCSVVFLSHLNVTVPPHIPSVRRHLSAHSRHSSMVSKVLASLVSFTVTVYIVFGFNVFLIHPNIIRISTMSSKYITFIINRLH